MKYTRGKLVGNIIATLGSYPGSASGIWNINDALISISTNTWPTYGAIPGAPAITGVSLVSGTVTSMDIAFTAPNNNGNQTITSYTAVSSPGSITGTLSQAGSGTIRVTGLTEGTTYTFIVYATNIVGNSANSVASSPIIAATVPDAPTIGTPTRVSGSGTEIDVPFSAPASNGGSTITSYTAVSSPGNITGTLSQAGSGTIRVTGLTEGVSYTFVVYATNIVGNSANSTTSSSIIPRIINEPDAPTIGTVTALRTTATVPYTAPTSNGGSTITSYTAVSSPGSITGTANSAGSGFIEVSGLTGNTTYTFVVYATNAVGNSANSASSNQANTSLGFITEYLIVAGGGGGGSSYNGGGGGGAGGLLTGTLSNLSLSTAYTITVGAGGSTGGPGRDQPGSNSVFGPYTAIGGGYGGQGDFGPPYNAGNGGSGGGGNAASNPFQAGGTGTAGQGYAGGPGTLGPPDRAGGGGGAGGVGGSGNATGSPGGPGANSFITRTIVTYAGGGGGGTYGVAAGVGGLGGGGNGMNKAAGGLATAGGINTGGGGGGGVGAAGGSGIVILKYPSIYTATFSGGLTTSTSTSGVLKVSQITAGTGTVTFS